MHRLSAALCPGGQILAVDDHACLAVNGVHKVLQIKGSPLDAYNYYPAGVAVIAKHSWAAQKGREALQIKWDQGEQQQVNQDYIESIFSNKIEKEGLIYQRQGDVQIALKKADEVISETYETPFWAHMPMEPMNTIAHWQDNSLEIWTPCHRQSRLLEAVVNITGFSEDQSRSILAYWGEALAEDYLWTMPSKPFYSPCSCGLLYKYSIVALTK